MVAVCAASAGADAALVPEHIAEQPELGVAFIAAALALAATVVVLATAPDSSSALHAAAVLLVALIAAYWLNVTVGLPWLVAHPEPVDSVGLVTKLAEAVGLVFAVQLNRTTGGRRSLSHKEARP